MNNKHQRQLNASNSIFCYFQNKWSGITAKQAFDEAKQIRIELLKQAIQDAESLEFSTFYNYCCHESVTPDQIR